MKQTLERILNQLADAPGESIVYLRFDYSNNGVRQAIEFLCHVPNVTHPITIALTPPEYDALKTALPVPDFHGYAYEKSPKVGLDDLTSFYKKLVLDELINEL